MEMIRTALAVRPAPGSDRGQPLHPPGSIYGLHTDRSGHLTIQETFLKQKIKILKC